MTEVDRSSSRRGVAIGLTVALAVPVLTALLALATQVGVVTVNCLLAVSVAGGLELSMVITGPIGIAIAGRAARVHGLSDWIVAFVLGELLILVISMIGYRALKYPADFICL